VSDEHLSTQNPKPNEGGHDPGLALAPTGKQTWTFLYSDYDIGFIEKKL